MENTEICLNVWCVVDEESNLIYRISARAYAIEGDDKTKSQILKFLAYSDYHLAKELPLLNKYQTKIISATGEELLLPGVLAQNFNVLFPNVLDDVCKELENNFPDKPIADTSNPRTYKMSFPENPYYVLTFLLEDKNGQLTFKA